MGIFLSTPNGDITTNGTGGLSAAGLAGFLIDENPAWGSQQLALGNLFASVGKEFPIAASIADLLYANANALSQAATNGFDKPFINAVSIPVTAAATMASEPVNMGYTGYQYYKGEISAPEATLNLIPGIRGLRTFARDASLVRDARIAADSAPLFSRIVPGGGLAAHEAAGGHLLKHVGQTESQLMARLAAEPKITGSSSFYNRAVAEGAVSDALDANAGNISKWMSGSSGRLRIDYAGQNPVGISVARGASGAVDVSSTRIILVRDPRLATGYRIQTGFPTK